MFLFVQIKKDSTETNSNIIISIIRTMAIMKWKIQRNIVIGSHFINNMSINIKYHFEKNKYTIMKNVCIYEVQNKLICV